MTNPAAKNQGPPASNFADIFGAAMPAHALPMSCTEPCTHADADLVEVRGNYPSDTVTLRFRCRCGASLEREYLPNDPAVNEPTPEQTEEAE
jgi:hypothetical protein